MTSWNHRKLIKLITWITAVSNSMKLWAMLSRATQEKWVMMERSDKTWSTEDGNRKPLQYSCLENPMNSIRKEKDRTLKDELLRSVGAELESDHELLTAKFRLKLKKVGKTTRPFRYDLNQIPYYYLVEVRNRFKGLDLIDGVPDELWKEVRDTAQETGIKTIPMEKKCKKENGCLRRPYK